MQNSQHLSSKDAPTVAKLLEIDADLAAHEADLMAQLQSIYDKRKSLKIVIDMFASTDTGKHVEASTPAIGINSRLEPSAPTPSIDTNSALVEAAQETTTQSLDDSQLSPTPTVDANDNGQVFVQEQESPELDDRATSEDATTQVAQQPNRKQKKAPTRTAKRRTATVARTTNSAKKTQGWQDYLREEFSDVSLSVAVSAVLQQHPEQALDITSVVDAIFVPEMPPSVRDKARDRVNNILSEGTRKNKWYRTGGGSYSISPI